MEYRSEFRHRQNSDGTFDAICIQCFRTIATQRRESDLAAPECLHVCSPSDLLDQVRLYGQTIETHEHIKN
jgi:hypothetical protein